MIDNDGLSAAEAAAALDPAIGDGTPATAPFWLPLNDDDWLAAGELDGAADDDDEVADGDETALIEGGI
jgi:hypothetical protein